MEASTISSACKEPAAGRATGRSWILETRGTAVDTNRRKKTRVNFETQVTVKTKDAEVLSRTHSKNISLRGVYLETDCALPLGTPCEVAILLSGTSTLLSIRVRGKVARTDAAGLGIVFESIDPDSYFHLKNLLMHNTSDPDDIERELHLI